MVATVSSWSSQSSMASSSCFLRSVRTNSSLLNCARKRAPSNGGGVVFSRSRFAKKTQKGRWPKNKISSSLATYRSMNRSNRWLFDPFQDVISVTDTTQTIRFGTKKM